MNKGISASKRIKDSANFIKDSALKLSKSECDKTLKRKDQNF